MADPRLARLARLITEYSVQAKKGDKVYIQATTAAAPLILEMSRAFMQCGANVFPVISVPGMEPLLFETASDEQLQWVPEPFKLVVETFDIRVHIASAVNTKELSAVDPAKQALRNAAMRPVFQTFMDRSASGALRWNVCMFPTDAYAQDAEMSLSDFEDFVYGACLCDQPDPVAAWQEVGRKQQMLIDYLTGKKEVHLVGGGTDLTVGIEGRTFVNCAGDKNMPDGEVFTGPEETKISGRVSFSFPAVYGGREVQGVQVWFEDGVAVKWTADKNEEFLTKMLATDEGARRLGEFAFGTNFGIQRFTRNMLFDEKIGGTVHMAFGGGYPETGSINRSAIHWDMLCDLRRGSEVTVDGELFAKDGKYLLWE
ncbi:MAG: aminopeptidase [Nitrososphaerales archaeon]